ncbi:MAG TPA: acylphosphatase [Thermoguttaceae bacterium]|nr:acylphosphatase [Thermoguttaceae bacterium]
MSQKTTAVRHEVHYSGRVHGVGFRYTVRRIASRFVVGGFVKNLPDGRVQLIAEGVPEEVRRFLDAVAEEMDYYISGVQTQAGPATGQFRGFDIRF